MTMTFEVIQWGLLLLIGAATAVNSLVMYRVWNYLKGRTRHLTIAEQRRRLESIHD